MSLSRTLVLAAALALGAAPPAAAQVAVVETPASAPIARTDAKDYASRESHDKQVAEYQGGTTVVIGITGGALLVLLFLLLII